MFLLLMPIPLDSAALEVLVSSKGRNISTKANNNDSIKVEVETATHLDFLMPVNHQRKM